MKLRSFVIKNFKSLQNVQNEYCGDLHTFVGRNSIGKSSIFEAIRFIQQPFGGIQSNEVVSGGVEQYEQKTILIELQFEIPDHNRHEYLGHFFRIDESAIPRFLGTDILKKTVITLEILTYGEKHTNPFGNNQVLIRNISVYDDNGVFFSILSTEGNSRRSFEIIGGQGAAEIPLDFFSHLDRYFSRNTVAKNQSFPVNYFISRLLSDIGSSFKIISSFREVNKRVSLRTISSDSQVGERGSELINLMDTMLSNNRERYFEIENYCKAIFPEIENISPDKLPDNQVRLTLKKKNIAQKIDLLNEGTGIDQLLVIIWKIATSNPNSIWLLDEPEIHLHPGAQKLLYEFLRDETQRGKQILVTTHSMVFMYKSKEDHVSLLLEKDGFAQIVILSKLLAAEEHSSIQDKSRIKDYVYKSLGYDPAFALEPLIVVMVEGKTDELVIKEFAKIMGKSIDDRKVMFIPIGDKKKAEQFSPILTYALSGKKSLIILDNDNEKPDDVKNKVLSYEKNYRKQIGIEYELLSDANFLPYGEDVYSIEHYLLDSNAICRAANVTEQDKLLKIRDQIVKELQKPKEQRSKPKDLLGSIWEDNGFGQYKEADTAQLIASKIEPIFISQFQEIKKIIEYLTA